MITVKGHKIAHERRRNQMGYKSSYEKWKLGEQLTRKESIEANCYECNGYTAETKDDCLGNNCALYPWSIWGKSLVLRSVAAVAQRDRMKKLRDRKKMG
jgi:hypothetical protein